MTDFTPASGVLERDLRGKPRPLTARALDDEGALERLDPVREATESGAPGGVGAAASVVGDLHPHNAVAHPYGHRGARRGRVLRDVSESLRTEEVGGCFDVRRKALGRDIEIDWDRAPLRERGERLGEAVAGELSRVQTAGQFVELGDGVREPDSGALDPRRRLWPGPRRRPFERALERDETPLGAIAEPLLEPAALRVSRLHEAPPRCAQLAHSRPHFGLEPCVRSGEPRGCGDRVDQARVILHGRIVHEHGERLTVALNVGDRAARPGSGSSSRRPCASTYVSVSGSQKPSLSDGSPSSLPRASPSVPDLDSLNSTTRSVTAARSHPPRSSPTRSATAPALSETS